MLKQVHKFSALTQNVILGSITGIMVGFNLRIVFLRLGGVDIAWIAFFLLGPTIGYLSGKERQRIEKLKHEKNQLEEDMENVQSALQRSNKKYRLLVEQANDAIFLTTVDGRFLLFNEATCRYSGYNKKQLKSMTLKDLHRQDTSKVDEAWLDNGVYRYEECWINRNKKEIFLEINARWIQFGDHRVILHVGRDVKRQRETVKKDFVKQIQLMQENRISTTALLHENLYKDNLRPIFESISTLDTLQKKYPADAQVFESVIQVMNRAKNSLASFATKNERDLGSTMGTFDLNAILHQELVYLDTLSDSRNFKVKTAFSSDLELVSGFGRDYSIAFGTLFQALTESMGNIKQKGLFISTRLMDATILVEIIAPGDNILLQSILYSLDPVYQESPDKTDHAELGQQLMQALFQAFDADFDAGYQEGKGSIVRIRVPIGRGGVAGAESEVKVRKLQQDVII